MNRIPTELSQPTIVELIETVLGINPSCRVFSFTRRPNLERTAGVCVVMIGNDAIHKLGPFLVNHLRSLPAQPNKHRVVMDSKCTMLQYFAEIERLGLHFSYVNEILAGKILLIVFVVGDSVTESFCAQLTALGCPTTLEKQP